MYVKQGRRVKVTEISSWYMTSNIRCELKLSAGIEDSEEWRVFMSYLRSLYDMVDYEWFTASTTTNVSMSLVILMFDKGNSISFNHIISEYCSRDVVLNPTGECIILIVEDIGKNGGRIGWIDT